ncbi:hypothetical protein CC78DRAFT_571219 [Lojkania enalia]|uniref:Uncharacterized protein n=1 Tax=Lojkania enalia TaxID=147567 RepID=A0A9P4K0M3_9PLEO|nr:hypothetical protein CC78DRAFT_571219 [Didymosphaeria enalia]
MADPVSLLASVVQVGDICVRLSKFLYQANRGIEHIDDDLGMLLEDIGSLKSIIEAIEGHFRAEMKSSTSEDGNESDKLATSNLWRAFDGRLTACHKTLQDLDNLCSKIHGDTSSNTPVILQRSRRWLRKYLREDELNAFHLKLSAHHENLQLLLTAASVIHTRDLRSTSVESVAQIRSLRSELRKGITSLQKSSAARDDIAVLQSAEAVVPLAFVNEHFSLPQAVSSIFVGRSQELDILKSAVFQSQPQEKLCQKRFVIYGLGGAGKSQFCCKFAQDNRHRFWGVFWVDATTPQSAKKSFTRIARLGKVDANDQAAKAWLSSKRRPWLLIIDNADDPNVAVEQYFPEGERGVILVTTRNFQVRTHGTVGPGYFHFKELDSNASSHLLLRSAGEKAPWGTEILASASEICHKLGFLPLAILHAGKAIMSHLCTLHNYLTYFEDSLFQVREVRRKRRLSETNITVFSSYELAFLSLQKKNDQTSWDAVELLKIFAFLHCQRIRVSTLVQAATNPIIENENKLGFLAILMGKQTPPSKRRIDRPRSWTDASKEYLENLYLEIKRRCDTHILPEVLRDSNSHGGFKELRLRKALSELHRMSLVEYNSSEDSYSMHPLIHVWVRERPEMTLAEQAFWCSVAGTVLAQAVLLPPVGVRESDQELQRDILPHVDHVRTQEQNIKDQLYRKQVAIWRPWSLMAGGLVPSQVLQLVKFSSVYAQNGLWREALKLQEPAANYLCKIRGKEHPLTIRLLLFMSRMYWALTEMEKASKLLVDLLRHCKAAYGEEDEDTILVLDSLGETRWQQGKFGEARKIGRDVVERLTRLHGPNHPDTFRAMTHLGRAVSKFLEHDEAIELHKKALNGFKRDLDYGPSHIDTLEVMDNLAMAYFDRYYYETNPSVLNREDLTIAHELEVEVVQSRRKKLGKEHPFTLWSTCNLARIKAVRNDGDDVQQAEQMIRAGLIVTKRNIGERHMGTLYGTTQLANVLTIAGKLEEATYLLNSVIEIYEEQNRGHPDQLVALAYLVRCHQRQGNIAKAETIRDKLLDGCRDSFGEDSVWETFFHRKYGSLQSVSNEHREFKRLSIATKFKKTAIRSQRTLRKYAAQEGCKPPKILPNAWLLPFGLDKLRLVIEAEKLQRYPLLMLEEHEKHGDTYAQYGGGLYTIITRDTENIRALLARQFKYFDIGSARAGCVKPLLGESIFTQDGMAWDHSRKLLAPLIKRPELSPFEIFEKHFKILFSKITSGNPKRDKIEVDLKDNLFDLTFSVITEFLLGPSASTTSMEGQAFAEAFNTAFKWISKRERLKAMYWLIDSSEFRQSCRDARELVDDIIKRTSKYIDDSSGMENRIALLRLMQDRNGSAEVRDQFLSLLLAGRDTSGSLLCWCIYVLARERKLLKALRVELDNFVGDRLPSKEDFGKMKLLDRFICEVLRLFPPVPINGRICNTTTTLPRGGGPEGQSPILVPKGSLICFSAYAAQTNKDLWDNASKFDVDRWSQERSLKERITDWSYQPFIGGPRKCLGETFAIAEAKYMVSRFLQHFFITSIEPNGDDRTWSGKWEDHVKYHVGLTMSPGDGVWVNLGLAK